MVTTVLAIYRETVPLQWREETKHFKTLASQTLSFFKTIQTDLYHYFVRKVSFVLFEHSDLYTSHVQVQNLAQAGRPPDPPTELCPRP